MERFTVLFTDPPWALDSSGAVDVSRASIERSILGDRVELRFAPASGRRYDHDSAQFLGDLSQADALVICRYPMNERVLEVALPRLKVVARQGVGFDNLNAPLLQQHGVVGFNIPDYCVSEVCSHALSLLLALERKIIPQHNGLVGGEFNVHAGGIPRRLSEQTASLVGFGRIGRSLSVHLRSLYGRVLACDPYVSSDLMSAYGVKKVGMNELLAESDALSLHCLLNEETRGLIGEHALDRLKPNALIVNVARGALVDGRALYQALREGRVGGAGLDVFSPEDPWKDEWWSKVVRQPNVVATSHRAFLSREAEESQRRRAVEGIRGVLANGVAPSEGHLTPHIEPRATAWWKAQEGPRCDS